MITCILKHSTLSDLTLPISSCSVRWLESPDVSTINVTVPRGIFYSTDINARIDGWLEVYEDGTKFGFSDSLTNLTFHQGSSSTSIQLTGSGAYTNEPLSEIELTGVSYLTSDITGSTRLRASFNPLVRPGNDITFQNTTYTVESVNSTLSQTRTMEVTIV